MCSLAVVGRLAPNIRSDEESVMSLIDTLIVPTADRFWFTNAYSTRDVNLHTL